MLIWTTYARALRVFHDGPADWHAMAAATGCNRMTCWRVVHTFHQRRLIHVAGWHAPGDDRRSLCALYRAGDKQDAPRASRRHKPAERQRGRLIETFALAVHELQRGALNGADLAEAIGVAPRTARRLLAALAAVRLVHIREYEVRPIGGTGAPLWSWGPDRQNAKRPRPADRRDLWTRHNAARARMRAQRRALFALAGKSSRRAQHPTP